MDADEIDEISATLIGAIAEARAHAKQFGINDEFRKILQHAGDMHDLLIEALIENEPLSTEYLRGVAVSTDNAIAQLAALADMPYGRSNSTVRRTHDGLPLRADDVGRRLGRGVFSSRSPSAERSPP